MEFSLWQYLRLLIAKRVMAIPALVATVVGVTDQFRGSRHQIVLSPAQWFVVAGVCVVVAQWMVWLDERTTPLTPEHTHYLRSMAGQLNALVSNKNAATLPDRQSIENFRSHFEGLAQELDTWNDLLQKEREAREGALIWIGVHVPLECADPAFIRPAITGKMTQYLEEVLTRRGPGVPDPDITLSDDFGDRSMVFWTTNSQGTAVLLRQDPTTEDAVEIDRTNMAVIYSLVAQFRSSPEYQIAKEARDNRAARQPETLEELRKVAEHVQLYGRCQLCVRQRKSSIYRRTHVKRHPWRRIGGSFQSAYRWRP